MKSKFIVLAVGVLGLGAGIYFGRDYLPPSPKDVEVTTKEETPVSIEAIAPSITAWHVTSVSEGKSGKTSLTNNGHTIVFAPNPGYYGSETLIYRVANAKGIERDAKLKVNVTFTPPEFHKRSEAASLAELMQQPPTTIYGSTINVFVYKDDEGALREITIAGHADSLTCSNTSGAFAGALIDSKSGPESFLLAGSGRLSIPEPKGGELTPNVVRFFNAVRENAAYRQAIVNGMLTAEQIENSLHKSLADLQSEIDTLKQDQEVSDYIARERPAAAGEAFLKQALEFQHDFGMVRVHDLSFSLVKAVNDRIAQAAEKAVPGVVTFKDLLPDASKEAVVYVPMMVLGSQNPAVIDVPLEPFTQGGFQKAKKAHRSQLENSVVGSAERRLEHAKNFLRMTLGSQKRCDTKSSAEMNETMTGLKNCNRDGCFTDMSNRRVTWREYCTIDVPKNIETGKTWQSDAERIIERIRELREHRDTDQVDTLTHAALVDAMLRNWALPFPEAQAAFDNWRKEGRLTAWRIITKAFVATGWGRAAFSGENLVFSIETRGDHLIIKPMMVIDVKRSLLVIDPSLKVTAVTTPWELRQADAAPAFNAKEDITSLLSKDGQDFIKRVEASPERAMSELIDALYAKMPSDGKLWAERAQQAVELYASNFESNQGPALEKDAASVGTDDRKAWKFLIGASDKAYAASHLPGFSPQFRLRLGYLIARALRQNDRRPFDKAWEDVQRAAPGFGVIARNPTTARRAESNDQERLRQLLEDMNENKVYTETMLFGEPAPKLFASLIRFAMKSDATATAAAIANATPPAALERDEKSETATEPVLTRIVRNVEQAKANLRLRHNLYQALDAWDEDGQVNEGKLTKAINQLDNALSLWTAPTIAELKLTNRYLRAKSTDGSLGPIEAHELRESLIQVVTAIDGALRELGPLLISARLGRDQEAIATRMMFDRGAYALAFNRLISKTVPLALASASMRIEVLAPDLRGVPETVRARVENDAVIISATLKGTPSDILRLEGLDAEAKSRIIAAKFDFEGLFNEGDALWEQVLLVSIPTSESTQQIARLLSDRNIHQTVLKAMVYACALPGHDLLDPAKRCEPAAAQGSTVLYDRVQREAGVGFNTPDESIMQVEAKKRFLRPAGWHLGDYAAQRP